MEALPSPTKTTQSLQSPPLETSTSILECPLVPTVAEFIASLPIPLTHLVSTFETLGLTRPADLLALASDTEPGTNARQAILDEVANVDGKGLSKWERIVLEESLKSGWRKWTAAPNA